MVTYSWKSFSLLCIIFKFVAGSYNTDGNRRAETDIASNDRLGYIEKVQKEMWKQNRRLMEQINSQNQMILSLQTTTALQQTETSDLKSTLKFQESELSGLKKTVKLQDIKLAELGNRVKLQETELSELKTSLNLTLRCSTDVSLVKQLVRDVIGEIKFGNNDSLTDNFAENRTNIQNEFNETGKKLLPRAISTVSSGSVVAFYAVMSHDEKAPSAHHTLIFDTVKVNEQGGYNEFSGMFSAPVDGLYVFSFSIHMGCNAYASYEIVKNAQVQGVVFLDVQEACDSEQVTLTIVCKLSVGNVIYVRTHSTRKIHGDIISDSKGQSSFAGWLLSA